MSLLHKVRHQRLRNWIILAVALLAAIAVISPEQLGVTLYKLSLVSIAAILGYQEGDAIDWRIADRTCRIAIRKVLYQPEAAGHFHL